MKESLINHAESPDYIERARYEVSRNLFTFLGSILGLLGIINLVQGDSGMYPALTAAIISIACLFILLKWKNYKLPASIGLFTALGLTIYNICIASVYGHFVDFFWVAIMAVYIFFVLGKIWGVVNLFLNIFAISTIFFLINNGDISRVPKPATSLSHYNFFLNILITGVVFSYITIKVLSALRRSEEGLLGVNVKLTRSNEEKTIMLKEIHHRVKNNLQVITSLLRLQLNEVEDNVARHHFTDSINRVSAMAIIHEKMYQTENLSRIDLASYLNSLINDLISSYAVDTEISTHIKSNIQKMDPESIVPLALIFNELVSNSLEHAFSSKNKGEITIDVQRNTQNFTTIHYSDNGSWSNPESENSFGMELIETFVEQLEGKCERLVDEDGTHYYFEFHQEL